MLTTAKEIIKRLREHGDTYIVGGAVRDVVLGKDPNDIDIATNVPMETIEGMFETFDIGKNKDFGIVVVKQDGYDFEVAQFRSDGQYIDGRRPETVKIEKSFKQDASRRDLNVILTLAVPLQYLAIGASLSTVTKVL